MLNDVFTFGLVIPVKWLSFTVSTGDVKSGDTVLSDFVVIWRMCSMTAYIWTSGKYTPSSHTCHHSWSLLSV